MLPSIKKILQFLTLEMWRLIDGDSEEAILEILDDIMKPAVVITSGKKLASAVAHRLTECGRKVDKLTRGIAEDDVEGHAHRMDGIDALVFSFNALLPADEAEAAQGMSYAVAPPLLIPFKQAQQLVVFGAHNFKTDYVEELAQVAIEQNSSIDIVVFIYGEGEKIDRKYDKLAEHAINTEESSEPATDEPAAEP